MPRGIDTGNDPRRQPLPEWMTPQLKPQSAPQMRPREGGAATIEQGMETRAWKYLGEHENDDD